ncbi:MAG: carotenoid biosynthesis protein [Bacteroidota bacterium]
MTDKLLQKLQSINLVPVLAFYFAAGAAGLIIPASREWFIRAVPFTLLVSLALLFLYHGKISSRTCLAGLLIFVLGLLIEMTGVGTGLIFGNYRYGDTLGLKVFHTPLMIGVNWLILVYCSVVVAGRFVEPLYFRSIVAGSMMVAYDFALEPAAIRLDMWSWAGIAVPLRNYLAWFVIAALLSYLAAWLRLPNPKNKMAGPIYFIQLIFFIALDIWIYAERIWGSL